MAFVCQELETTRNIYGGFDCKLWVQQPPSILAELAITRQQSADLSLELISLLTLAWIISKIIHMINRSR